MNTEFSNSEHIQSNKVFPMRIVSLIIISIAIFLATFFYLKSTQKALNENVDPTTKENTYIGQAKKAVEELNKATEETAKELEKITQE